MEVLFASVYDWGNVGNLLCESLKSVGCNAVSAVRHAHPYKYATNSVAFDHINKLQVMVNKADVVFFMHSELWKLDVRGKKVASFHGGTRWREKGILLAPAFNKVVDISFVQTADLLGRGLKNEYWLPPPVNTEELKPLYKQDNDDLPTVFAHYPRNQTYKGTPNVLAAFNKVGIEIKTSPAIVAHTSNLLRMQACDVYVERMRLKRGNTTTGIWGMTALEAAALGKIVLTNDIYREQYEKTFGAYPLQIANSIAEMSKAAVGLRGLSKRDIVQLQTETRQWVEEKHSFKSVGARLKEVLEKL